jgi:predicted NBD/HSP70 family sugar kinase
MAHYAGLDVSDKETAIHVVDGSGKMVWRGKRPSEPDALASASYASALTSDYPQFRADRSAGDAGQGVTIHLARVDVGEGGDVGGGATGERQRLGCDRCW